MMRHAATSLFITVISFGTFSTGINLPKYIYKCPLREPNLSQCFEDAANIAIPKLVKGNNDFGIPPLSYFKIPNVYLPFDSRLTFQLTNASAGKLEDARYLFSSISRFPKLNGNGTLYLPELRVFGNYSIEGKIKGVPLNGSGPAEITFSDVFCKFSWNLDEVQKNGITYFKLEDLSVSYRVEDATYVLSDLSAAGRSFEKEANGFLNRNWRVLGKLIVPSVVQGIRNVGILIAEIISDKIPVTEY